MKSRQYQLAQINIAKARVPMDSEIMRGFVERIEATNALANGSPGFVWRWQGDMGEARTARLLNDPNFLLNVSVWVDVESLKNFVYRSAHLGLIQAGGQWFDKMPSAQKHQALWWAEAGHLPTPEEAKKKLDHLRDHGATSHAFSFGKPFPPPQSG